MSISLLLAILITGQSDGTDLHGKVVDASGKPITNAHVFVYTAGPRQGTSVLCPSCYPDCTKEATTDSAGLFTIKSLDRELIFRILAVAEGYRPRIVSKVDPVKGIMTAELAITPTGLKPRQILRGRVVDRRGKPIMGAVVEPHGTKTESRRWWGRMPGVDAVSVSNKAGEFLITTREPKLGFDLKVSAPNFARRNIALLPTGTDEHTIQLTVGVGVDGRLLKDGRPVPGVVMGLVQLDRSMDNFIGEYEIATDENGNFEFLNVHPNDKYLLYTKMASTGKRGALKARRIEIGGDNTSTEIGTLSLGSSFTISGQVKLTDGKPLPKKIRLLLSRDKAWDTRTLTLDSKGRFSADGVPREPIVLHIRVPGYRLASRRNRFQQTRCGSVALFVDSDRQDLEIYLEPTTR